MKFLWSSHPFRKDKAREIILNSLKNNFLFEKLTSSELSIIEGLVHVRKYSVGEDVFRQHQPGAGMYIIASGKVCIEVEKNLIDPKTNVQKKKIELLATLSDGDFFGESALVGGDLIRSTTARVIESALLIGFFKPDMLELIKDRPTIGAKICYKLAQIIGKRLEEASEELLKQRLR